MAMNNRLLRPRASGFNPKAISGLAAWWDASKTASLAQNSDGTVAVSNGDPVAYWADLSGNGRHMTQPTNGLRPTLSSSGINGRPSISVPNVSNAGFSSIARPTASTDSTVFLVASRAAAGGNANSVSFRESTGGIFFDVASEGVALSPATSSGSPSYRVNGVAVSALRSAMHTALGRGTQFLQTVSSLNFSGWPATWQAFDYGSSFNWIGLVGECLIYSRALTVSERDVVEAYLDKKWQTTPVAVTTPAPAITTTNYAVRSFGTVTGTGTAASPLTYSVVNGKYSTFTVTSGTLSSATLTKTAGGSSSLIIRGTAAFTFNGSPASFDYDFEDYRITSVSSSTHTLVFPTDNTFSVDVQDCGASGCQVSFTLAFA